MPALREKTVKHFYNQSKKWNIQGKISQKMNNLINNLLDSTKNHSIIWNTPSEIYVNLKYKKNLSFNVHFAFVY